MKVFDQVPPFADKVNFVDENNVVLGYDMNQCCCEEADWFVAPEICITEESFEKYQGNVNFEEAEYVFDTIFFEDHDLYPMRYEGGLAIFRLVGKDKEMPPLYLHLFNCHNGYYGHGFQFKEGDKVVQEGYL